jgi:hypothetical protein
MNNRVKKAKGLPLLSLLCHGSTNRTDVTEEEEHRENKSQRSDER